jgi:hypothetical protein
MLLQTCHTHNHVVANPTCVSCCVLHLGTAVDNTIFSPESPLYPSAVKALAAAAPQRIAGVSGAGVTSLCNPENANYEKFYAVLGRGSWLQELPQATHLSYAQTPLAATPICGKGSTTPAVRVE